MEIKVEKQDESIQRLNHLIPIHITLSFIAILATIYTSLLSTWWYCVIAGGITLILLKNTYQTFISLSNPRVFLNESEILIKYFKYGYQIATRSLKRKNIVDCYINDNTNFMLFGFSIILKTNKNKVEIGLALKPDNAKSIEKSINNWL